MKVGDLVAFNPDVPMNRGNAEILRSIGFPTTETFIIVGIKDAAYVIRNFQGYIACFSKYRLLKAVVDPLEMSITQLSHLIRG